MKNDLEVCSHCWRSLKLRLRGLEDIGFWFHWVGDCYCIDAVLYVDGVMCVLFSEVYVLDKEHEQGECDKACNL